MPDLTIETHYMCASLDRTAQAHIGKYTQTLYGGALQVHDECTCPAFKYSKDRDCKHLRQARAEQCSWHGAYDESAEQDGVCPRCGGEAIPVRVAV
jgi:hypothetical protein